MGKDGKCDAIDTASCTTPRIEDIPLIVRREIEARAIAPFYDALVEELGQGRADRIVRAAVARLGEESGRALAGLRALAGMLGAGADARGRARRAGIRL